MWKHTNVGTYRCGNIQMWQHIDVVTRSNCQLAHFSLISNSLVIPFISSNNCGGISPYLQLSVFIEYCLKRHFAQFHGPASVLCCIPYLTIVCSNQQTDSAHPTVVHRTCKHGFTPKLKKALNLKLVYLY